jgi:hypothetical protein
MRGARSLAGGIAAALLVSTLGVLGAAGSAVASVTAAPAATSISIRALKPMIQPGQVGRVVGNLQVPGRSALGRSVALEARAAGEAGFTPVGTVTANQKGGLSLSVRPEVSTRYRWHYVGAADARSRFSGVVVVRVRTGAHPGRRITTTLSVRAVSEIVAAGERGVVRGTLLTPRKRLRGQYVVLLARTATSNGWRFRDGVRTGWDGRAVFTVRPHIRTTFRLAFAGTKNYRPVRSGTVRVEVRPVATITADPSRIDPGGSTDVIGTVAWNGSAVAGATVKLLSRAVGERGAWDVVRTGTTDAEGSISTTVSPAVSTRYRLRVRPLAGLPAGTSPVITVGVRAPSSLSIRGQDVAAGFAVSGQLRAQGQPVRNAAVTLQTFDPVTRTWTDTATEITGRTGVAQFLRPSAPGTDYRLLYVGMRFATSTSATLTD